MTLPVYGDAPPHEVELRTEGPEQVERVFGRLIGFASSRREEHRHPGSTWAPVTDLATRRREHCTACRWFEVRIVREHDPVTHEPVGYVVHTLGNSAIPDDRVFARVARTTSPFEVVELLTKRRHGRVELPAHSARALAAAAQYDVDLERLYLDVIAA